MDSIQSVLEGRVIRQRQGRVNSSFERAKMFLEYVELPARTGDIIFILKLCKKYTPNTVYSLQSWLKDLRVDRVKWKGLIVWRLEIMIKNRQENRPIEI